MITKENLPCCRLKLSLTYRSKYSNQLSQRQRRRGSNKLVSPKQSSNRDLSTTNRCISIYVISDLNNSSIKMKVAVLFPKSEACRFISSKLLETAYSVTFYCPDKVDLDRAWNMIFELNVCQGFDLFCETLHKDVSSI